MKKRLWSMLLAVEMCLTMMPVTAVAAESTPEAKYSTDGGTTWHEDSLIGAIYKCYTTKSGQIELLRNIALTSENWSEGQILANKNCSLVIDGKGYTLTRDKGISKLCSVNTEDSVVTLKDITLDGGAVWSNDDPATRTNSGLSFNGNAHLVDVSDGGKLILDNGAVLQNCHMTKDGGYGAAVSVGSTGAGTLVMKDGAQIKGNTVFCGAVYIWDDGDFTMEGGKICGNYGMNNGGAVCMGGGQFTMSDGEISGNKAFAGGGGVSVFDSNSKFTMSGGSITDNTIGGSLGGGVLVYNGNLNVSGNPVVKGNTMNGTEANNVFLQKEKTITIQNSLTSGASIGVTMAENGTAINVTGSDNSDYSNYFFSDSQAYNVKCGTDNVVQLVNIKPTAPTNLRAEAGNESVKLTWKAPAVNGGSEITGYEVSCDGGTNWISVPVPTTEQIEYTFTGLTANQKYQFQVRAINSSNTDGLTAQTTGTPLESVYTVTFNANGGSCESSTAATENYKLTTLPTPIRGGYTFDGWYTAAQDGNKVTQDTIFTEDTTIYAHWTRKSTGSVTTPTYPPTVTKPGNGDVAVSPTSPKQGEAVTITPKPDNGYEVDKITVTDNTRKEIAVEDNGDGTYSFTQPSGSVTIAVTYTCKKDSACPISKFTDAKTTAWYHDGVHYCIEAGLMEGIGNAKFSPDGVLTRAQLAQILYNKAGKPAVTKPCTFTDVPKDAWYADAVAWAQQNSVVSGIDGNKFAPEEKITREQIAAMLYRSAGSPAVTGILNFKDAGSVSKWATDAMLWATQNKVINGALQSDGALLLNAKLGATRAETATMLENYYNK